jgi:RND family efflux transporter MFP subunit
MSESKSGHVVKAARPILAGAGSLSDSELLRRYASLRDEAAFEALVRRHERLVFGLCRRVLSVHQDAEDAFQATFLVLARKAKGISRSEMVGTWLYKVAYRIALAARARRAKNVEREKHASKAVVAPTPDVAAAVQWAETLAILDDEVHRLPTRLRSAVVLCYFDGKTVDEAADSMGCPRGTMASRLARARDRLREGLARRGLALSGAALAAGLTEASAGASPPLTVVWGAVAAAALEMAATGCHTPPVSAQVISLTQEAIRAMAMKKTLAIVAALAVAVFAVFGGGVLGMHLTASGDGEVPEVAAPQNQPPSARTSPRLELCKPVEREVTPFAIFAGKLKAKHLADVISTVSGYVTETLCRNGATVKAGDVVFRILTPELTAALERSTTNRQVLEAELKRWDAESARVKKLLDQAVLDRQTFDEVQNQRKTAALRMLQADDDLQRLRKQVEGATIVAPAGGTIGEVAVASGSYVPANKTLAKISQTDPMGVVFDVDEATYVRYMQQVREMAVPAEGAPITVSLLVDRKVTNAGKISRFDDHFDPKTGTIEVHGAVPNPRKELLAGMSVQVRMELGKRRKALLLPESAVFTRNGQCYVTVFSEKQGAEERRVSIGPLDDGWRVIEEGLKADEWVVKRAR